MSTRVFRVDDIKEQKLVLDRKWRGDLSYQRDATPYVFYRVILVTFFHPTPIQSDANHTGSYLIVPSTYFIILYLILTFSYTHLLLPPSRPISSYTTVPYPYLIQPILFPNDLIVIGANPSPRTIQPILLGEILRYSSHRYIRTCSIDVPSATPFVVHTSIVLSYGG